MSTPSALRRRRSGSHSCGQSSSRSPGACMAVGTWSIPAMRAAVTRRLSRLAICPSAHATACTGPPRHPPAAMASARSGIDNPSDVARLTLRWVNRTRSGGTISVTANACSIRVRSSAGRSERAPIPRSSIVAERNSSARRPTSASVPNRSAKRGPTPGAGVDSSIPPGSCRCGASPPALGSPEGIDPGSLGFPTPPRSPRSARSRPDCCASPPTR